MPPTEFGKYSFFDCGSYALFTLQDERFQPIAYGKQCHSPQEFFAAKSSRIIDLNSMRIWRDLGFVLQAIGSGGTVLDVGAYIGTFCIPLGPASKAAGLALNFHSFEPGPNYPVLSINIDLNDLGETITTHELAVSGYNGYTICQYKPGGAIGGTVFGKSLDGALNRIVPCCTIDSFCAGKPGKLFIKLDTQGH